MRVPARWPAPETHGGYAATPTRCVRRVRRYCTAAPRPQMASRLPVMPRAIVVQAMAFSPWLALPARAVLIGFGSVGQVGGASWGCAVSVLLPAVYVTARVAPGVYIPTLAGGCACCSCSAAAAFAAREEGVSVAS